MSLSGSANAITLGNGSNNVRRRGAGHEQPDSRTDRERGIAVQVKDLVRLPDTRACGRWIRTLRHGDGPSRAYPRARGPSSEASREVEPAGCGPQRCHAPYGDSNTAVEDVAADDMAADCLRSRASVTTRLRSLGKGSKADLGACGCWRLPRRPKTSPRSPRARNATTAA